MSDSDDDVPQLSADTLEALKVFYEQKYHRDQEDLVKAHLEDPNSLCDFEFEENWQLSQFWYDDSTAEALATEAIRVAGPKGAIALVSCPSVYRKLKKLAPDAQVALLEYDKRFELYGEDFVLYDYRLPLNVPTEFSRSFDVVVADPPFLSQECLEKTAETIKYLMKDKIILCTGATMEQLAESLLGVHRSSFKPRHKNNLANEFQCFANYNIDEHIQAT